MRSRGTVRAYSRFEHRTVHGQYRNRISRKTHPKEEKGWYSGYPGLETCKLARNDERSGISGQMTEHFISPFKLVACLSPNASKVKMSNIKFIMIFGKQSVGTRRTIENNRRTIGCIENR